MCLITITVPDTTLAELRQDPAARTHEVQIATAIGLYARGRASLSEATQVSGLGRVLFAEQLRSAHIPINHMTEDDFALEFTGG